MAIVINGSGTVTGLAVGGLPDGTVDAGTLATNSVDSAEIVDGSVDRSKLNTSIADSGNATAITIDSSERVGIQQTSPAALLSLGQDSGSGDSAACSGVAFKTSNNDDMFQISTVGGANNDARGLKFSADGTERMRMSATGHLLIGTTSVSPNSSNAGLMFQNPAVESCRSSVGSATSSQTHWRWYNGNGQVGHITSSGSATNYSTSSDYRLKENVDYTWDATTRLKQLKPARFNFIADDTTTVDGFLAHEAQAVVPECVSGTKDAMTAEVLYVEGDELPEGKVVGDVKEASVPDMQGIDQSKLVPLLVKTIQELEARITALEA